MIITIDIHGDTMNVKKLTKLGLMTTVALIIFIIELKIPSLVPISGVKLGLANIITIYCVYHFSVKETTLVVLSRIILGSMFSGNISTLFYSLGGSFLCLIGMFLLSKIISEDYIWICSIFGAILHNIGQILVAIMITQTLAIVSYLPFLLVSGCIAGAFTGISAQMIIKKLKILNVN